MSHELGKCDIRVVLAHDIDAAKRVLQRGVDVILCDLNSIPAWGLDSVGAAQSALGAGADVPWVALVERRSYGPSAVTDGAAWVVEHANVRGEVLAEACRFAVILHERQRALHVAERRYQLAEILASMGQIAAEILHEIRNPTAYVMANLQALQAQLAELLALCGRCGAGVDQQDDVRAALIATVHDWDSLISESLEGLAQITAIIRNMRSFATIDQDEVSVIELADVVSAACSLVTTRVEARARLRQDVDPKARVLANRSRLIQVLVNLLCNAADAITPGAPTLNLVRVAVAAHDGLVVVAVEDSGCGIPDDISKLVYEPFFTTKSSDGGTGLGLSLAAEIVRGYHGELSYCAREGGGTRFELRLPADISDLSVSPTPRSPAMPTPDDALTRAKILLIDDEPNLLSAFRRWLGQIHDVITAQGGREGLRILANDPNFDVIICDLMMPDIDGVAVYEAVQADFPSLASRIVFLTGGAVTRRGSQFIANTKNPLLEKPVRPETLLALIKQLTIAPDESADERSPPKLSESSREKTT